MELRKRVINVGGDTLGIRFTKNESEMYGLCEGDILDLGDMVIEEGVRRKKK